MSIPLSAVLDTGSKPASRPQEGHPSSGQQQPPQLTSSRSGLGPPSGQQQPPQLTSSRSGLGPPSAQQQPPQLTGSRSGLVATPGAGQGNVRITIGGRNASWDQLDQQQHAAHHTNTQHQHTTPGHQHTARQQIENRRKSNNGGGGTILLGSGSHRFEGSAGPAKRASKSAAPVSDDYALDGRLSGDHRQLEYGGLRQSDYLGHRQSDIPARPAASGASKGTAIPSIDSANVNHLGEPHLSTSLSHPGQRSSQKEPGSVTKRQRVASHSSDGYGRVEPPSKVDLLDSQSEMDAIQALFELTGLSQRCSVTKRQRLALDVEALFDLEALDLYLEALLDLEALNLDLGALFDLEALDLGIEALFDLDLEALFDLEALNLEALFDLEVQLHDRWHQLILSVACVNV
eukprot:gene26043-11741_t